MERYFVDLRIGCCAVRDRTKLANVLFEGEDPVPEGPGLHAEMQSVVQYWHGRRCRDGDFLHWEVSPADVAAAHKLCSEMNL